MFDDLRVIRGQIGVDIGTTAKEALKCVQGNTHVILLFNGIHIYVNGRTVDSIVSEYQLRTSAYGALWEKTPVR